MISTLIFLVRALGLRGSVRRLVHEVRKVFGWFRARPRVSLRQAALPDSQAYRVHGNAAGLAAEDVSAIIARGERVLSGAYQAYGGPWLKLPGSVNEWLTHPVTGYRVPDDNWWRVNLLPAAADIKDVWEPARFSWAYDLARAYAVTGDPRYGDAFHHRLASWCEASAPFRGVHWACGQETAIRALAILFASDTLPLPTRDADAARQRILDVLAWSGERIADAIGYGLSQRNNHGLSESAGLVHIGLRLKGLHPAADDWVWMGRNFLEEQVRDQFYADGWYGQHSFTYMRIAMEQVLLAQRALQEAGQSVSAAVLASVGCSCTLLVHLVDARTGHVPNHGANDGGRAACLSAADYRDFRAVVTLAAATLDTPLPADVPADRSTIWWLGLKHPAVGPSRSDGIWTGSSGWLVARIGATSLFTTAGRFRHRPSQLDSLHLDVRLLGSEAVIDPGTFSYNRPAPWNNGLSSALVHNAPVLDDREPATRATRFLWRSWPVAHLVEATFNDGQVCVVAEVPGAVRREIRASESRIHVHDVVLKEQAKSVAVTWLLDDRGPPPDVLVEGGEVERVVATEDAVVGWFSPTYGVKRPAMALRARRARRDGALAVDTTIGPGAKR